jgi:hypothetical protein
MQYYNGKCLECGAPFVKFRIDRQFCTDACRMRDYRRSQRKKLERLENSIRTAIGKESIVLKDLFA